MKMRGYQQAHMSKIIWGYEDAKIQTSTHEPEDMRCKEDARIQANTCEPEDIRMQRCKDTTKHTGAWGYEDAGDERAYKPEDIRMWGCEDTSKYTQTWGCEDVRIQASAQESKDMRMWGCEDIKQVKYIYHVGYF